MKNDSLRRLPPPPLFTIRPPPKPPGSMFENFHPVEILNGQCVRPSLNLLTSPTIVPRDEQSINWFNIFLLILAIISVICCIIILIFIFLCLKKLRKEEKQYQNFLMSGSLSLPPSRHHLNTCSRTSEHYKCTSNTFNCCEDYYSHQLIPVIKPTDTHQLSSLTNQIHGQDTPQNHQYECIPDYLLTMTRRHHPPPPTLCQHYPQTSSSTCLAPYSNFSRLYLTPQEITTTNVSDSSQCTCSSPPSATIVPEESSTPLLASTRAKESQKPMEEISLPKSMMIGWTRRDPLGGTKRKGSDKRHSFLSHLRKSSIL